MWLKIKWGTLVNKEINFRAPQNASNFLTSWEPFRFSIRTLLHGARYFLERYQLKPETSAGRYEYLFRLLMSNVLTKWTSQERSNTSTPVEMFRYTGNLLLFVRMLHNYSVTNIYTGVEAIQSLGTREPHHRSYELRQAVNLGCSTLYAYLITNKHKNSDAKRKWAEMGILSPHCSHPLPLTHHPLPLILFHPPNQPTASKRRQNEYFKWKDLIFDVQQIVNYWGK